jgi:hypothetical protein
MLNGDVIPRVAVLMAKDEKVSWHGRFPIGRFKPIAQLGGFAESSFGEMDMIDVRSFAGTGGRGGLLTCSRSWCALSLNECNRRQEKECGCDDSYD